MPLIIEKSKSGTAPGRGGVVIMKPEQMAISIENNLTRLYYGVEPIVRGRRIHSLGKIRQERRRVMISSLIVTLLQVAGIFAAGIVVVSIFRRLF